MAGDQRSHLIKIDRTIHAARLPDLHSHPTAIKPGPKRTYRRLGCVNLSGIPDGE
jgi:hypothetical protein